MKIKHSKYRNTGLIYELLVRQIAGDTLANKESKAIKILKKFYNNSTYIAKENKLYSLVSKYKGVNRDKAEAIISTITELSRKSNRKALKKEKYELISEIKKNYNIEDFFSVKVANYKPLAALYCLIESQTTNSLIDPDSLIVNKSTLLEHFTSQTTSESSARESLVDEFSKYEKDLKLLTYKILLEKFNTKYNNLLPDQKRILKEVITSVSSYNKTKEFINEELVKIDKRLKSRAKKIKDDVLKIKLNEVVRNIKPLEASDKVEDKHLVLLLQYHELLHELKNN